MQPVIPLLLNTAINLARPIPSVQEYPSNPPPIPPPPEKYYASTEICKVSIKEEKKKKYRPVMRSMTIGRGELLDINAGHLSELCQTPVRDLWILRRHGDNRFESFPLTPRCFLKTHGPRVEVKFDRCAKRCLNWTTRGVIEIVYV